MDFYDKELIDLAAKEIGFSPELIADKEQRVTNSLLYNFAMGSLYGIAYPRTPKPEELPLTEQIFIAQKKIIQDAARRSSCVFVGRCADYILKDRDDVLKVFIYCDKEIRRQRALAEYGEIEDYIDEFMHQTDKKAPDSLRDLHQPEVGPPGELRYYVKQRPAGNRDLRADTLRCGKVGKQSSKIKKNKSSRIKAAE